MVLKESDVVVLIGARLNWLLAHGKGKTWGGPKKFVQIDIQANEMDSNVPIDAPLVGDIGSCVAALRAGLSDMSQACRMGWRCRRKGCRQQSQAGRQADHPDTDDELL